MFVHLHHPKTLEQRTLARLATALSSTYVMVLTMILILAFGIILAMRQ